MLRLWINLFCIFFLALGLSPASGQRLIWKQYTTNHGLPGNEVYEIMQDARGYLWIATAHGLCRFNGYEFVQPVDTSASRGTEVFLPVQDDEGRIWFTRLDGSVWRVEKDTIRAWEFNEAIAPYRQQYRLLEDLAIETDGTVWLAFVNKGFLKVSPNGHIQTIADTNRQAFIFAPVGKHLLYTTQAIKLPEGKVHPLNPPTEVIAYRNGHIQALSCLPVRPWVHHSRRGFWQLRNGDLLHGYNGIFYLIRNDRLVWQVNAGIIAEKVLETPDGEILMAAHSGPRTGLFYFQSLDALHQGKGRNLLPGYFVTDVETDQHGGWWVSTHHAGIRYCKNPDMEAFDTATGLPYSEVTCLSHDAGLTLFAGFRPAAIAAVESASGQCTMVPVPPISTREVQTLYFDTSTQRLWCSDPVWYRENGHWYASMYLDPKNKAFMPAQAKTLAPDPYQRSIWAAASQGFFQMEAKGNQAYQLGDAAEVAPLMRTFSVTPDVRGNLWVTTADGLKLWREGRYQEPPFHHPALRFQPRQVVCWPGGQIAISLRSAGLLIRDTTGSIHHLTKADGLCSDLITKLYLSSDGTLFACSNAGLSRIVPQRDGSWHVLCIDAKEGLPSNQINDVAVFTGYTWVATDMGLVRFHELPAPLPMPPPVLERLLVNNRTAGFEPGLQLPHTSNTLSIRFYALHYRSEGRIPYRYRLGDSNAEFTHTSAREVQFANLSPGRYTFEVQAQNEAGQWSAPTVWAFDIRPAWWQTGWFWAALLFTLVLGIAGWYRSRLQKARRELEMRHKIRELESAALRAQMNPHFIFNCLTSIQHFITENDATEAANYLARFARLVRLALHGSVDGTHTLREEVEMLESYLALEQLRFPGRFTYDINIDASLAPDDIYLPPMLVQPFVENALLHGMKNKTLGGRIGVTFALDGPALVVTVSDNGPGMETASPYPAGRKSVGMMLTQRRLDILTGQAGETAFRHENITDAAGNAAGMRVELRIPVEG